MTKPDDYTSKTLTQNKLAIAAKATSTVLVDSYPYPDHISDMPPVVVGDNFTIQGENAPFGVHHWIPLQLQAGVSYAAHGLFTSGVIVDPGSLTDLGTSAFYALWTREIFISLRDSQGQLVPGKTSGRDFAFSTPTKGVYYLDVSGPYPGFNPDDGFIETAHINFTTYQDDYVDNTATKGQMAKPVVQAVTVKGSVEVDGDHDWFKVSLDAGKQVLFSVKPTNTSPASLEHPVIHLYDSTGKVINTGDDSQQISFAATKSGNYYVDVSGWVSSISRNFGSDNGTYTLTATPKADDYGNTPLTAGHFDFGVTGEITGNIETKGDHDWVAVKLLAGRSYFFSLSGAGSAKPVAGQLNTVALALRDAKGVLIDQGEGAGAYTSKLVYMPEKSATYYLDASALKNTEKGHYTFNEWSYQDDNPNHPSNIKPLELGVTLFGNMDYKGDHDFLAVKAEAGKAYDIFIRPTFVNLAPYDIHHVVRLRDAAGALITTGNIYTGGNEILVKYTAPKSGVFYIDIAAKDSTADVIYAIRRTGYQVGLREDDYSADKLTAGKLELTANSYHSVKAEWAGGNLDAGYFQLADADWFKVSLQKAQTYTVALTANQGSFVVHNNVSVVDSNGKEIKLVAFSDDSISFVAPYTGAYFLNVHKDDYSNLLFGDTISYTLIGQQGVPIGTAKNDVIKGGDGADLLYGRGGNDTINGGNGRDIINGGIGKDMMVGGAGNDYYFVDNKGDVVKETSTLTNEKDIVLSTVSYTLPANVETLILVGLRKGTESLTVLGRGNQLDNTLIGQSKLNGDQDTEILRGGGGDDTLSNKAGMGQRYLFGEAGNDTLSGYGHLVGGVGNDTLISGYDDLLRPLLVGGVGKDTYDIKGSAIVEIARGDSLPASFDVAKGFTLEGRNLLDLSSNHIAKDVASVNGKDVGAIHSHHISQGLISFDDLNKYTAPLAITADKIADAIKYLQANITKSGDTVAFVAGHDTYVFQDGGSVDTLVQLVGVAAEGIHNTAAKGAILLV